MRKKILLTSALLATCACASVVRAQDVDFAFSLADSNHDGLIDSTEAKAFAGMQWTMMAGADSKQMSAAAVHANPMAMHVMGPLMPKDGGVLSRAAFIDGQMEAFKRADANGDGTLDESEFRAYLGAPPEQPNTAATAWERLLPSLAAPFRADLPTCEQLGGDSRFGLAGVKGISNLSTKTVAATPTNAAYCRVQFVYDSGRSGRKDGYAPGQHQAIGLRIGLPLRNASAGAGWNGRIENLGSGGCMGNLPSVTVATDGGFVGSSSDGGHGAPFVGFNCDFGVQQKQHQLNKGLIRDFTGEHIRWQTLWTKKLVDIYYGQAAHRTYWSGCSQGGREANIALQTIPQEYDGILGGGAALYWMRFQMAQAWSGVVIKDMLRAKGENFPAPLIHATVAKEIAACDALDGVKDGVLGDPRQCHWSATAAICGASGAIAKECLSEDQAAAFDTVRRGPRNSAGQMIWFPWEPGTEFSNQTNYLLSDSVMQWAVRDLNFKSNAHLYMDKAALKRAHDPLGITYADMATLASQEVSDLIDVDNVAIDPARRSGVKVMAWTGTADRNIFSRDTIKYYRDVAAHFGDKVGDPKLASWYRVFLYPGVDHCSGGVGPQPGNYYDGPLFHALVDWVEQGKAPERIIATKAEPKTGIKITRPVCPYPQTAIYKGNGSVDDAANFRCGGNLETPRIVAQDALAPHKKENGTGVVPANYNPPDYKALDQQKATASPGVKE